MKIFKSKTIWFAVGLSMLGAAQITLPAVQSFIQPQLYGWVSLGIAVAVAGLRALTTTSLSDKTSSPVGSGQENRL